MNTTDDGQTPDGDPRHDRWEELQIDRLLYGLSPEEQLEYDELAKTMPGDSGGFERVVASIDVAWRDVHSMPLPDHLRRAIRDRALRELSSQPAPASRMAAGTSRGRSTRLPWAVAAVCLALALYTAVVPRWQRPGDPNFSRSRAALISSAPDVIERPWSAGPPPIAGAEGDVTWSPLRQEGYMRFRGLPVNDPAKEQYQLWIFDRNQDEKTPVDGGVFDISATGEAVIPIHPKLKVKEAYLFAVTIEKPGGVVVSSRERLPLLAAVDDKG